MLIWPQASIGAFPSVGRSDPLLLIGSGTVGMLQYTHKTKLGIVNLASRRYCFLSG